MNRLAPHHALFAAVLAGTLAGVALHYGVRPADERWLPDAKLTPGDTLRVSTTEVCTKGYAGKTRNVSEATKREVYARYGIKRHKPGQYEIDHLISLELGGSNAVENLWPQSYSGLWNAHLKDSLENKLHSLVCDGTLTLEESQEAIRTDWVEAYERFISH